MMTYLSENKWTADLDSFRNSALNMPSFSQGSAAMTQGFCTDISSSLLISSLAALYGLSHHGRAALLLPVSPCRVPQMPCSSLICSTAMKQLLDVLAALHFSHPFLTFI